MFLASTVTVPAEIIFSILGFETQNVAVTSATGYLAIAMEEDSEFINESVVTALGVRRQAKSLGYAVQEVGGDWGGMRGVDDSIFPCQMEVDYVRIFKK